MGVTETLSGLLVKQNRPRDDLQFMMLMAVFHDLADERYVVYFKALLNIKLSPLTGVSAITTLIQFEFTFLF